jgi:cytochrome c-type protein NapC
LSEPVETSPQKGIIGRIWAFISRPNARFSLGALVVLGGILGVLFWGGFNWALELTNNEAFCISCHEMRNTPYAELQNTIHFKNRSGVRATCPDCHVPKQWIYKIMAKIEATTDLYHHILGDVDTPENFDATGWVLAQGVWQTFK